MINTQGVTYTRLNYTYFHPEGVEQQNLYEFRQRSNKRILVYEVHKVLLSVIMLPSMRKLYRIAGNFGGVQFSWFSWMIA